MQTVTNSVAKIGSEVKVVDAEIGLTYATANSGKKLIHLKKENPILIEMQVNQVITNFLIHANAQRSMSEEQVYQLAIDLIETFGHESLEDIVLMFKMARQGQLKEHFGTVDGIIIGRWMGEYLNKKAIHRENHKEIPISDYVPKNKFTPKKKVELEKLVEATRIDKPKPPPKRISFEEHYSLLKYLIISYDKGDKNKLVRLRQDMLNNDTGDARNYKELVDLINQKIGQ